MGTAIIVAALVIIALIAVRSYMKKLTSGCCGAGDKEKNIRVADTDASHYPYHAAVSVSGMTCKHCVQHVENAFNKHDGVWAVVDLKKGLADVRAKKAMTNFEVRDIVSGAGYTATDIKVLSQA